MTAPGGDGVVRSIANQLRDHGAQYGAQFVGAVGFGLAARMPVPAVLAGAGIGVAANVVHDAVKKTNPVAGALGHLTTTGIGTAAFTVLSSAAPPPVRALYGVMAGSFVSTTSLMGKLLANHVDGTRFTQDHPRLGFAASLGIQSTFAGVGGAANRTTTFTKDRVVAATSGELGMAFVQRFVTKLGGGLGSAAGSRLEQNKVAGPTQPVLPANQPQPQSRGPAQSPAARRL